MQALTAPQIASSTGIVNAANSGNYAGLIQAAGPAVGTNNQAGAAAKQQILNTIPAGAGQQAALAQLPYQVANANAGSLNSAYQGALSNLTQIGAAYGGVGLSEAGAGTSAANSGQAGYSAIGNEQAAGKADTMGFLGQLAGGAGTAVGGYFSGQKGCWIAESIYGVTDPRTHLLRAYLNGPFADTRMGSIVMWVYLKVGRNVAWVLNHVPVLKGAFKPLFERALVRARDYGTAR